MKTTTNLLLVAGLMGSQAQADILASWRPVAEASPGGAQYANTLTSPVAEVSVPEFFQAIAFRTNSGNNGNAGAVWPGSADSTELDPAAYTSFSLEIPSDAAVSFDSFSYVMNTYDFERETLNPGTPEEEIVLNTLQLSLRSSLDNFESDLASVTSLPADRVVSNNINSTFDLSQAADLQDFSGVVEFRLYIWEESEVVGYNPFTWIDMATGGATFEGIVTDPTELTPIARNPLVEIFPEPKPEAGGLPANTTAVAPTLVSLAPEIGSVEALRIGHENFGNRGSVWPGRVSSMGFDEFSYLEVTITPGPGATFSIAEFIIPQINTYATDDGGSWEAAIRSNLDGFSDDLATTSGAGTYQVQFNLAGESSLRDLSAPLTFRVYLWETALIEGAAFDPQMWFDIAGNATGTAPGIQIIGEAQAGSIGNPSIASALYIEGTGFQIEAVDLTPGRSYDIAVAFDLIEQFTPLQLEQTATGTTLTFVDGFADASLDSKAFYRIQEVVAP